MHRAMSVSGVKLWVVLANIVNGMHHPVFRGSGRGDSLLDYVEQVSSGLCVGHCQRAASPVGGAHGRCEWCMPSGCHEHR